MRAQEDRQEQRWGRGWGRGLEASGGHQAGSSRRMHPPAWIRQQAEASGCRRVGGSQQVGTHPPTWASAGEKKTCAWRPTGPDDGPPLRRSRQPRSPRSSFCTARAIQWETTWQTTAVECGSWNVGREPMLNTWCRPPLLWEWSRVKALACAPRADQGRRSWPSAARSFSSTAHFPAGNNMRAGVEGERLRRWLCHAGPAWPPWHGGVQGWQSGMRPHTLAAGSACAAATAAALAVGGGGWRASKPVPVLCPLLRSPV